MIKTSGNIGYVMLLSEIIRQTILTYSTPSTINRVIIQNENPDKRKILICYESFLETFCDINKNKWAQILLDNIGCVNIYRLLRICKNMAYNEMYKITGEKKYKVSQNQIDEVKRMLYIFTHSMGGSNPVMGMVRNTNLVKSVCI